jgi:hypothetical protein
MGEKKQRDKEKRRKDAERRASSILDYELLNLNSPDKRSDPNRRSGKDRRIK